MSIIRLIVSGSRTIDNNLITFRAIQEWHEQNSGKSIGLIISGGARGPDTHAIEYANNNNISYIEYIPDWDIYGKKAGMLRNIKMANDGDEVIAVYDGKSRGTRHMIDTMLRINKPAWIYNVNNVPMRLERVF